jgi:hypothetical protein
MLGYIEEPDTEFYQISETSNEKFSLSLPLN